MSRRLGLSIAAVLTLAAAAFVSRADEPPPAPTVEPTVRSISIQAKRFEFAPASITLARDEPVDFVLTTEDVHHGFFSRELGVDGEFEPGKSTVVRVVPRKSGTFTIICDHFCGSGHGNMKLAVEVR